MVHTTTHKLEHAHTGKTASAKLHGKKSVQCPDCGQVLSGDLNRHRLTHQPGTLKYQCSWPGCGMRARQKSNVKTHYDSVHLQLYNHNCPHHIVLPDGMVYKCPAAFKEASSLNKHRRAKHDWTPGDDKAKNKIPTPVDFSYLERHTPRNQQLNPPPPHSHASTYYVSTSAPSLTVSEETIDEIVDALSTSSSSSTAASPEPQAEFVEGSSGSGAANDGAGNHHADMDLTHFGALQLQGAVPAPAPRWVCDNTGNGNGIPPFNNVGGPTCMSYNPAQLLTAFPAPGDIIPQGDALDLAAFALDVEAYERAHHAAGMGVGMMSAAYIPSPPSSRGSSSPVTMGFPLMTDGSGWGYVDFGNTVLPPLPDANLFSEFFRLQQLQQQQLYQSQQL